MHRKALGRGLEALIPPAEAAGAQAAERGPREIAISDIAPNPLQPRSRFDDDALAELAASIRSTGVLQPVLVRQRGSGYQLVAGERRLRAAQMAGLQRIPAIARDVADRELMEIALIENLQREDLNPIDEAKAYQMLISSGGLTHEQISERVGKQRSSITNAVRLLDLTQEVQDLVSRGTLSAGHARALLALESRGDQLAAARYVQEKGFSVRRTEAFVARKMRRRPTRHHPRRAGGMSEWENRLQQRFATRVRISQGRRGGRVEFEYYGEQDLERLLEAWGIL